MGFGVGQKECVAQTQVCEVWGAAPSIKDGPPRGVLGTEEALDSVTGR